MLGRYWDVCCGFDGGCWCLGLGLGNWGGRLFEFGGWQDAKLYFSSFLVSTCHSLEEA